MSKKLEKPSKVFDKYNEYMQSVIPRLIAAEKVVDEIKGSPEWTRALNYFNVLYKRGGLEYRPTKENGYRIERSIGAVQLEDIADILTPEQLEQIRNLYRKDGE